MYKEKCMLMSGAFCISFHYLLISVSLRNQDSLYIWVISSNDETCTKLLSLVQYILTLDNDAFSSYY